jgi:hypothetical protein
MSLPTCFTAQTLIIYPKIESTLETYVSAQFRPLLQVREIIHDFHNSRYATCFAALEALRPVIACDIHLHDHATALYR